MKEKLNILILGQNGFIGKNVFSFFKKKKFNLLKYSKKKYWERNINTIKYNHNILIINKINELTIFYMESNTNLIKRIY